MRGDDQKQTAMFSYLTLAQRIPTDHPAGQIRVLVDRALERMDGELEKLYSDTGRPSIAPERLLRATLLMILFSIRGERLIEGTVSQRLLESVLVEARDQPAQTQADRVDWFYRLTIAAHNLMRMRRLIPIESLAQ
jgi:hypothetical protein